MFGRKKKEADSVSMNESYTDNSDIPDEMVQKIYRQPVQQNQQVQQVQPIYYQNPLQLQQVQTQPIQNTMNQMQPVQMQQVQPVQKPRTAIIVKTELQDNGEFINTVITNYQLNIGYARLEQ